LAGNNSGKKEVRWKFGGHDENGNRHSFFSGAVFIFYGTPQDERINALKGYGEKVKKTYAKSAFRTLKHFEIFAVSQ
jgi:hypothetical protein